MIAIGTRLAPIAIMAFQFLLHVSLLTTTVLNIAAGASRLPLKRLEVTHLPGWDGPLRSRTYAGFVELPPKDNATKMYEHYLYFESENSPDTDPVVMWTNGGPGASSFFGSFSELGPYYLTQNSLKTEAYRSTRVPTLFLNEHRWTKLANLLVRNLPPPIGFSYCDPAGPTGDGYSCGPWNDTSVAQHSALFLKTWLTEKEYFPERRKNELFLVGESYAGVYVPTMARELLRIDAEGSLNLKVGASANRCGGEFELEGGSFCESMRRGV